MCEGAQTILQFAYHEIDADDDDDDEIVRASLDGENFHCCSTRGQSSPY